MRDQFTFDNLLPSDLADAVELIQQPLPTDPLSAVGTLLCGYSGLLKIGTRVASDHQFSVPCNLYWANVGVSGLAKTPIKQKLVDDPAKPIRILHKDGFERAKRQWEEQCAGIPKKDRPPEPRPRLPHAGGDYSPEALGVQLQLHEADGLGLLLIRDEISGLLKALDSDKRSGRGTGEAQFLELFDGGGGTSLRVESARYYERSHVSLFGNIQPDVLRRHVNGDDASGKWARILFNQLPVKPLDLRYEDPTCLERQNYALAQKVLEDYALAFHKRAPGILELDVEARRLLLDWFKPHQQQALAPTTSPVVSALLGKTSAQALRLAGLLYLVHNIKSPVVGGRVSSDVMQAAMDIVDTLVAETRLFHQGPEDFQDQLMRKVHKYSWNDGEPRLVQWQKAKAKDGPASTKHLRALGAPGFLTAIVKLEQMGYGTVTKDGTPSYAASRPMP